MVDNRWGFTRTVRQLCARWRVQAYLDLMWMLRDFKLCMINLVSDAVLAIAGVMAVFLLVERFDGIGAWSKSQIVFMLGYAALVRGILEVGFGFNILQISRRIGRGQMDHVMIQPQPIWMILLTEGFLPVSGTMSLFTGTGIMIWAMSMITLPAISGWWLWFVVSLLSSSAIVLALTFLWGSLAFWSPVGAEEISSQATRFVFQLNPFPLDAVGPLVMNTLMTVLPIGFVAWYPCQALLGLQPHPLWKTPLVAVVACTIALFAFNRGLKRYEQTGSQRYVGWAHRS
jgi:ABC-2 type transport system permease protein